MLKKYLTSFIACFLLLCSIARADSILTANSELKTKGIDTNAFKIVSFSPDGKYLLGYQKNSPLQIRKGNIHTFFLLTLDNGKITKIRPYNLRVQTVEQTCFTPDSKAIIIITKSGSAYVKLDLETGKASSIMEHRPDTAGFRAYPPVMMVSDGKMITTGYYYNENDAAGHDTLSFLDPAKQGTEAFASIADIQTLKDKTNCETFVFPNSDFGYLGTKDGNSYRMYSWKGKGDELTKFDEGVELHGFWGNAHRLVYGIERGKKNFDLMLYDSKTDKTQTIASSTDTPYKYVFLSADGKTLIACKIDEKAGRMSIFTANEDNNWELQSVKGLGKTISMGYIRISYDGKRMLLHNENGLRIADL